MMRWHLSWRADPSAREIADRHYNRQKVGADQFVPPGRCLVLIASSPGARSPDALWITSWPMAEYVKHAWAGAWTCSAFRNEAPMPYRLDGPMVSSELIRQAVAATVAHFGPPPAMGFVSFVDGRRVRRKRDPGRCFLRAGWRYAVCETCDGTGKMWQQVFLPDTGGFEHRQTASCTDCDGDGRARTKDQRLHVLVLPAADVGAGCEANGSQTHLWRQRSDIAAGAR